MLDIIFNSIIPFVIILTILVFVHELGHYLAAIKNNVKVEVLIIREQDGSSLSYHWVVTLKCMEMQTNQVLKKVKII